MYSPDFYLNTFSEFLKIYRITFIILYPDEDFIPMRYIPREEAGISMTAEFARVSNILVPDGVYTETVSFPCKPKILKPLFVEQKINPFCSFFSTDSVFPDVLTATRSDCSESISPIADRT